MARKDVELVIRAKNDASKAIDAIGAALQGLTKDQDSAAKGADRAESALDKLTKSFGDLNKSLAGTSALGKIEQEVGKAAAALARLEAESAKTAQQQQALTADLDKATAATARLRTETQQAAEAQAKSSAALARQKADQKELSGALEDSVASREKLRNADARMVDTIDKQEAAVDKARTKYEALAVQVAAASEPTQTLQTRLQAAGEALAKQESRLAATSAAYIANRAAIQEATTDIAVFTASLDKVGSKVSEGNAAVKTLGTAFTELKAATIESASAQAKIQDTVEKTAASAARTAIDITKARESIGALGTTSAEAAAEIGRLAQAGGETLNAQYASARKEMLLSARAMHDTQDAAQTLGRMMAATTAPTEELIAEFEKARVGAKAAKDEYMAQKLALQQLKAILTGTMGPQQDPLASVAKSAALVSANRGKLQETVASIRAAADETVALGVASRAAAVETPKPANEGANANKSWSDAFQGLFGDQRQALSLTQRLRGEVLQLAAAYIGFQAAIEGIKKVVDAYTTLQGVQNRLNVATGGDQAKSAAELDFVRRNADRLGISFGVLADEYSKFSVATQGTNLEGEKTRKIFLAVAEAAKVNKLSIDDTKGVFLALEQMVSKGSVQMEELRGQLGERLPGAVKLFADGLGVSTDQLLKMMEAGQVSSDSLDKFADALNAKFGGALQGSLQGTSAEIGKFGNNVYNALLIIGKSDAIEKFTAFLADLNTYLKSSEAESFFKRLGVAIGLAFDALGFLINNVKLVVSVLAALIAIRLVPFFVGLGAAVFKLVEAYTAARVAAIAAAAATAEAAVAAGAAGVAAEGAAVGVGALSTAVKLLGISLKSLLISTVVGAVLVAIGEGLAYLLTRTDSATEALNRNKSAVDDVKNAYDKFGKKPEQLADALGKISVTQIQEGLKAAEKQLADLKGSMKSPIGLLDGLTGNISPALAALQDVYNKFQQGEISAQQFKKAIDDLAQADPQLDRKMIVQLITGAEKATEFQEKIDQSRGALIAIQDPANKAAQATLGVNGALDAAAKSAGKGAEQLEKYHSALNLIYGLLPDFSAELKKINDLATLNTEGMKALGNAITNNLGFERIAAVLNATGAALKVQQDGSKDLYEQQYKRGDYASSGVKATQEQLDQIVSATSKLAEKLGLDAKDLIAVMSFETGGTLNPNQEGPTTKWGTHRGLFQAGEPQAKEFGITDFSNVQQQVDAFGKYLLKAGVKAGDGLLQIEAAVNAGNAKNVNASDTAAGGTAGTVRDKVRDQFGPHVAKAEALLAVRKDLADQAQKEQKDQDASDKKSADYTEDLKTRLEVGKEAVKNKQDETRESAIALAVAQEQRKAEKAGAEISEENLKILKDQVGAKYDAEHADDAANAKKKEAADADKTVNDLMAARNQLIGLYKLQEKNGDTSSADATKDKLKGINTELGNAIDNAIKMHQAIGGPGADAAIAKLQAMKLTSSQVAQTIWLDWNKVGTTFASTLTSAFGTFADEVAKGTSIGEAARKAFLKFASDFLKQVANMIIQQAILNAIKAAFPSFTGAGGLTGLATGVGTAGVLHSGGIAGSSSRSRSINPAVFAGAASYHTGGVAGLAPNETPAILEKGEEILTAGDPRHRNNGGLGVPGMTTNVPVKVVNAIDSGSVLEHGVMTRSGERAIINFMRANKAAIKSTLG